MQRILTFIFVLMAASAFAQQKITEIMLNEKAETASVRLIPFDDSGRFVVSIIDKTSIERYIAGGDRIDADAILRQSVNTATNTDIFDKNSQIESDIFNQCKDHQYITGTSKEETVMELFHLSDLYDYVFIETNFHTGKSVIVDSIVTSFKEKVFLCFGYKGSIFILSYKLNSNDINIYKRCIGRGRFTKTTISINTDPSVFPFPLRKISSFFQGDYEVLQNNKPYPPLFSLGFKKMYQQEDKIILNVASDHLRLYQVKVDCTKGNYTTIVADESKRLTKKVFTGTFSYFLVDSSLILSNVIKDTLFFDIYNHVQGRKIKSYKITEQTFGEFRNGQFSISSNLLSKTTTSKLDFKDFIKTARNNPLGLSATSDQKNIYLNVETYSNFAKANKLMSAVSLATLALAPPRISFFGGFNYYPFPVFKLTNEPNIWEGGFNTTLSLPGFGHSTETKRSDVLLQIQKFLEENHVGKDDYELSFINGVFYLQFTTEHRDKYMIFKFLNN